MVERCVRDAEVASSNLVASTHFRFYLKEWPHGQAVKTTPSHGVNSGSIPDEVIESRIKAKKHQSICSGIFYCKFSENPNPFLQKINKKTRNPSLCKRFSRLFSAGPAGFEPSSAGVKVLCLTAWRWPIITSKDKCLSIISDFQQKSKTESRISNRISIRTPAEFQI